MSQSTVIKIIISLALLALISLKLDYANLPVLFDGTGPVFWSLALMALIGQIGLLAWRWQLFANLDKPRLNYSSSWRITIASLLANLLFITSLGGVIVRVGMTTQYGFPLLKSICAGVADRIMTLVAIALLAVGLFPLTINYFDLAHFAGVAGLMALAAGIAILLVWMTDRAVMKKVIFYNRKTALAAHYIREMFVRYDTVLRIILVSLAAQILYFTAVYFLTKSMSLEAGLAEILAVLPFVTLVASLPVGFGGWGIREGAFIYGFGLIGIPVEAAFVLSVQIGVLTMISTFVAGIPALITGDARDIYDRVMGSRFGQKTVEG